MHIPDGYLSPASCATLGAAMVPIWLTATRRVRRVVKSRYVPLVALGAAYCFLVMMFNVPIPDGTSAHAVGAVLVAVLLGPWAAIVAVSVALAIQALFFGDGGVLAFGANAFNMAFVMPVTGYALYRLLTRGESLTSTRRAVAAGIGGYLGLNAAAMVAAVEFGLQPTLFHAGDGTPLYAPFHLTQTIPAMAFGHLLVAGFVEGVLTAGVIRYLQQANLPVMRINHRHVGVDLPDPVDTPSPRLRWAVVGLATMVVLTPLGLLAPGAAFGEDAPDDLDLARFHLNAVPVGLRHYADFWHHTMFGGYGISDDAHPVLGYLVSATVGLAVIFASLAAVVLVAQKLGRRQRSHRRSPTSHSGAAA